MEEMMATQREPRPPGDCAKAGVDVGEGVVYKGMGKVWRF